MIYAYPTGKRLQPCKVTNEGREIMDEELQKFNEEYLNLGPQYQIPNPELGPLERRVQQTYVDGLLSGEINLEDSEYWFTEPAGSRVLSLLQQWCCVTYALHGRELCERAKVSLHRLCCPGAGGWNQTEKIVRKAKVVPSTHASAAHAGSGRVTTFNPSPHLSNQSACMLHGAGVTCLGVCSCSGHCATTMRAWSWKASWKRCISTTVSKSTLAAVLTGGESLHACMPAQPSKEI